MYIKKKDLLTCDRVGLPFGQEYNDYIRMTDCCFY